MIRQLLEEVKSAPLDEASRNRLKEIHRRSIKELESGPGPRAGRGAGAAVAAVHRGGHALRRASCGSPRPSWSAGSRGSSTASRPRSTPSRWRRARSSSRCAARCPGVRVTGRARSGQPGQPGMPQAAGSTHGDDDGSGPRAGCTSSSALSRAAATASARGRTRLDATPDAGTSSQHRAAAAPPGAASRDSAVGAASSTLVNSARVGRSSSRPGLPLRRASPRPSR